MSSTSSASFMGFAWDSAYTTSNKLDNMKNQTAPVEFNLVTETPSEAIIRINLAKPENIEKFSGRFWHGQKGDGKYAVLGTVIDHANIKFQGHTFNNGEFIDHPVEFRITEEQCEALLEGVEEYGARVAEVKLLVTGEPAIKELTIRGVPTNAVVFWGTIQGFREGSAALTSDEFTSKEDVVEFLKKGKDAARQSREQYRAMMQMANEVAQEQSENALA